MKIQLNNESEEIKIEAGDLIVMDNGETRLIVHSITTNYIAINLEDGTVGSFNMTIKKIKEQYKIKKVIKSNNLLLSEIL